MNTTTPIPPPGLSSESTHEVLRFAQNIAEKEIASIERLHQRTMKSIGYLVAVSLAFVAVLGWFGYDHVKNAAIVVVHDQIRTEVDQAVKTKVDDLLKKDDIAQIVREKVHDTATEEIAKIAPKVRGEVESTLHKRLAGRTISPAEVGALSQAFDKEPALVGQPIYISVLPNSVESYNFYLKINEAISGSTHLKRATETQDTSHVAVDGIGIYYDEKFSPEPANALRHALESVHIHSKAIPSTYKNVTPPGKQPALILYVGANQYE